MVEKKRSHEIVFEYAGDRYLVSIENTGNLWKSMVDHDLSCHDRLCDVITYDSIIRIGIDLSEKIEIDQLIYGWDDIVEHNRSKWKHKDCRVSLNERNDRMWFEFRFDSDGKEYCQVLDVDMDGVERMFEFLKDTDSLVDVIEDSYGMDLDPRNALPCDSEHRPMTCVRMTMEGAEIVDLYYWSTEEEAIADADRCLESMTEEEAERLDVVAGYVDFDFPSTGEILDEIPLPEYRCGFHTGTRWREREEGMEHVRNGRQDDTDGLHIRLRKLSHEGT